MHNSPTTPNTYVPPVFLTHTPTDPELVKSRCLELGMPEEIWDLCLQKIAEQFVNHESATAGYRGHLIGVPSIPMRKSQLEKGFFKQYHPNVEAVFSRMYPMLQTAYFYISNDPKFPSLLCNDAEPFARATNHYEGLRNEAIREFVPPKIGRPVNPNREKELIEQAQTKQARAEQRKLEEEERLAKSARFREWKEACAAHRIVVSEAHAAYTAAFAHAEELRLYWKGLTAPKLKP